MNVIYDGKIKKFSKKENLNYILSNNNSKSLEEPIPNTLRIENKNKLSFFDENDIKKKDLYF
jgi:hypothetical protein